MSTISKCCSPWVPTTPIGKVTAGILVSGAIALLVVGILAAQSKIAIPPPGAQAMMGVGGAIVGLYVMQVLCCRCRETDGYFN